MNFYASPHYLSVLAEIYFPERHCSIEDVRVGKDVLRLLVVDKKKAITTAPFLDYHEPLNQLEIGKVTRTSNHARFVARRSAKLENWGPDFLGGFELAPYIDWTDFPTYDDYKTFILSRQRGLIRENERRGRRLVDKFGQLQFRMDDKEEDVFRFARKWKSEQLRATGEKDYFDDPRTLTYFTLLREKGLLVASTLRAGRRLLSVWLGFVYDGVWSGWVFTYDPELRKYSVGHQLVNMMIQKSRELRHREFDFSIGREDYKMLYATHVRVLEASGIAPLSERIIARAKKEVKERHPSLFEMAKTFKRNLDKRKYNRINY